MAYNSEIGYKNVCLVTKNIFLDESISTIWSIMYFKIYELLIVMATILKNGHIGNFVHTDHVKRLLLTEERSLNKIMEFMEGLEGTLTWNFGGKICDFFSDLEFYTRYYNLALKIGFIPWLCKCMISHQNNLCKSINSQDMNTFMYFKTFRYLDVGHFESQPYWKFRSQITC